MAVKEYKTRQGAMKGVQKWNNYMIVAVVPIYSDSIQLAENPQDWKPDHYRIRIGANHWVHEEGYVA